MNTTEVNQVAAQGQEDWQNDPNVEGSRAFNEAQEQVRQEDLAKGVAPDGTPVSEELQRENDMLAAANDAEKILTPEEQQLADEEELKAFVANPENKEKALNLAQQMQEICPKWFSLEMLCRKSGESHQSAFQKLKLVELFGMLTTRIGDHNDDRQWLRKPVYKVVISVQDQIDGLERVVQYHTEQAAKFKLHAKLLRDKLQAKAEGDAKAQAEGEVEKKDPEN